MRVKGRSARSTSVQAAHVKGRSTLRTLKGDKLGATVCKLRTLKGGKLRATVSAAYVKGRQTQRTLKGIQLGAPVCKLRTLKGDNIRASVCNMRTLKGDTLGVSVCKLRPFKIPRRLKYRKEWTGRPLLWQHWKLELTTHTRILILRGARARTNIGARSLKTGMRACWKHQLPLIIYVRHVRRDSATNLLQPSQYIV